MKLLPTSNDSRRVFLWALLAAVSLSWLAQGAVPEAAGVATGLPPVVPLPPVVIELPPIPSAIPSAVPAAMPAAIPAAIPAGTAPEAPLPAAPSAVLPVSPPAAASVMLPADPPVIPPPLPPVILPVPPPSAGSPPAGIVPLPANFAPQMVDIFSVRTWQPPPPPVNLKPEPPARPQVPPLPFRFLGKIEEPEKELIFLLARGDRVISVSVGQLINGTYLVEKHDAGRLYFIYKPLKVRQSLSVGHQS